MAKALLASEFSVRPVFGPHPVESQGKGPWPVVADPSPTSLFPSRVGGRLGVRTGPGGRPASWLVLEPLVPCCLSCPFSSLASLLCH